MNKFRLIYASAVAAKLAVVFAVVITIWAELTPALKTWLASLSGHHWTSKSLLTLLIYTVSFAYAYSTAKNVTANKLGRMLNYLIVVTMAGTVIIIGFYIWHA